MLEQTVVSFNTDIHNSNMNPYVNIPTPPSSNEDSLQPIYYVSSPESSTFVLKAESYAYADKIMLSGAHFEQSVGLSVPHLKFIEQPTDRFRFRYKSEMAGTHGSLNGVTSDKSRKQTFPTVEICNFNHPAVIRCSIYQVNAQGVDFMPHAHRLIKKHGKDELDDPHDITVSPEQGFQAVFHSMGIIHTAKKNIVSELIRKKSKLRKEYIARTEGKVRDLTTKEDVEIKGLAESESKSINLNIVCLRFDAFVVNGEILQPICEPIYSHGINNLKSALTGELKIVRMDHVSSPCKGGREIFIFVERVTKKNIKVRFFELDDEGNEVWDDYGRFSDLDVHHQYAIAFKTPKYRDLNITSQVKVYIELYRPSDQAKSEPKEFIYTPSTDNYKPGTKRSRHCLSYSSYDSSSSVPSDELPAPINNLSIQNNDCELLSSKDLEVAMNNIDSEEFNKLFESITKGNEDLFIKNTESVFVKSNESLFTDGLHSYRNYSNKLTYGIVEAQMGIETQVESAFYRNTDIIKREVLEEDSTKAKKVYSYIEKFMRTNPPHQRVQDMLHYYFGKDGVTNALHVFVMLNNVKNIFNILRLMCSYKTSELINVKDSNNDTPLHIAVSCNNFNLVRDLIICEPKISIGDGKSNTALHVAVLNKAPVSILEVFLSRPTVKDFIDLENADGDTPLNIAIENEDIIAVKLLSMVADVNKKHKSNGFTPLRFAIEKQNVNLIQYILSLPNLDWKLKDFNDVSALHAGLMKGVQKIEEVIKQFLEEKDSLLEIKKEIEDYNSDQDPYEDDETEIKTEPCSMEQLRDMYSRVNEFTPQCLDAVSEILDESGNCYHLAELLELDHLLRNGLIGTDKHISKSLLTYSVEKNRDSLYEIRSFLENLDELRAVEIMDEMVKQVVQNY